MAEDKETRERVRELVKQVLANVPMEEEPAEHFPQRVVVNSLQDKIDKEFDRDESAKNLITEDDLRGLGLSRPKVRTLRALAEAIVAGAIDLDDLAAHPDATIREKLVALHGIGPWTADIFLMFNLGRADAFASGDLALQEAARMGLDLDARPDAQALEQIAERWRPWRAVAALMLWNYYRVAKQTKGGAPV